MAHLLVGDTLSFQKIIYLPDGMVTVSQNTNNEDERNNLTNMTQVAPSSLHGMNVWIVVDCSFKMYG